MWANGKDEWVRILVREALATGRSLTEEQTDDAYEHFRQEKGLVARTRDAVPELAVEQSPQEVTEPLRLTRLSDVAGVNAIQTGSVIEPHAGLTILFGENGTGKTGYARVLKALAGSRSADKILGNVEVDPDAPQSATIEYTIGVAAETHTWSGEQGRPPFTRMAVFDTPALDFHLDADLDYVVTPTSLALFKHVIGGIKSVQERVASDTKALQSGHQSLIERFSRDSSLYPLIETLGASTDLADLKSRADFEANSEERIAAQQRVVAALEANTAKDQLPALQRAESIATKAVALASSLIAFDGAAYNESLGTRTNLAADYQTFRTQFFQEADLPTEPDDTWQAFITSGQTYREHLETEGVHDESRSLYCRQSLSEPATALVAKYREYLDDRLAGEVRETKAAFRHLRQAFGHLLASKLSPTCPSIRWPRLPRQP